MKALTWTFEQILAFVTKGRMKNLILLFSVASFFELKEFKSLLFD